MRTEDMIRIRIDDHGVEPTSYDELRPGCDDVHERIRDMNANGVRLATAFVPERPPAKQPRPRFRPVARYPDGLASTHAEGGGRSMAAKRIVTRLFPLASVLVLLAGCSTNRIETRYEFDPGVRLEQLRSYAWVTDAPLIRAGQSHPTLSPMDDARIRASVDRMLAEKGYRAVDRWDEADVLVTYTATAADVLVWYDIAGRNYSYHGFHGPLSGHVDQIMKVRRQIRGVFSVQFYDPVTRRPIWVGLGERRISEFHGRAELIDRIVRRILEPLPRAS